MRLKRAILAALAVSALSGCAAEPVPNESEPTPSTPATATTASTTTPTPANGPPIDPLVFCETLLADEVLPHWEESSYGLEMAMWLMGLNGRGYNCYITPDHSSEAVAAATGGYSNARFVVVPDAALAGLSGVAEFEEGRDPTVFLDGIDHGTLDTELDCQHVDGCPDGTTGYVYYYEFKAETGGALVEITIAIATIDRGGGQGAQYQQPAIDAFLAYMKTIIAQLT